MMLCRVYRNRQATKDKNFVLIIIYICFDSGFLINPMETKFPDWASKMVNIEQGGHLHGFHFYILT
jgi:hypothetical protein